jgi:2-oxoisovalerate dehydrogenase E2 component (dihydrolipoyl transacylase)
MAATERVFAMPDLGEGLEDGEIIGWLVSQGDEVELNQPLVEVETAKATVEVPSPFAGVVVALHGEVGSIVAVGAPLATFASSGDREVGGSPSTEPARTTPPVRRLARDLGVDLATVAGSGPGGRITADDVQAASGTSAPAARPTRAPIATALERQAAIPQVTTFRTVDCSALESFRAGLEVSPLPIVVAALCRTIVTHPELNARWGANGVEERPEVHVGLAADTERGLVVPVVRGASTLGIAALTAEIGRLAEAARAGSLTLEELTGATIAVSNTGSYGSEAGTPILSPGTSVTLALGVIAPRALVVGGDVVARPATTLSCTFDHRVLDGAAVGRALNDLIENISSTERLEDLPR